MNQNSNLESTLKRIEDKIDRIEERLDNHLQIQKTTREKLLVVSTLVSTTVAIVAVIVGL